MARIITRRRFLQASAAAFGSAAGVGLYTWRWEPHWLELVERALPVASLPSGLVGARLVQLSDLHIGPQVDDDYLRSVFARVKELEPEFVVYTGDFVSYYSGAVEHAWEMFAQLPLGTRATLGTLGNHDYGPRWNHPEVADELADIANGVGVRILRNEVAEVDGLQIAGLDDLWAGRFYPGKALGQLDAGRRAIVLSHNPDTVDEPGWGTYRGWILSGHTHGGQCKAPFLPPPLLPVRNRRYTRGVFNLEDGRKLYINRGVGHLLQVRFNVRPEVTVFRLVTSD